MARLTALVLIFSTFGGFFISARADMSVEPTRIVLSQQQRTATIIVKNNGLRRQIIRPIWTNLIQGSDANLYPTGQEIPPEQIQSIRIWPGHSKIDPGTSIQFHLLLDPNFSVQGETRHHLRFNMDPANGKGPKWAVVVPVFARAKMIPPDVEIVAIQHQIGGKILVILNNKGGNSPHGHLIATAPNGQIIAELHNVNVYNQNQRTSFQLETTQTGNVNFTVQYLGDAEFTGMRFAQKTFQISQGPRR